MTVSFYVVMLGLASGVTGVVGRRLLAAQGFIPGIESGLAVAGGLALAYAAAQLGYLGLLRLLKPSSDRGPVLFEALSQAAACALLPYLAGIPIPWPHPALAKAELGIFGGAFLVWHAFFKLVSLFSASQSRRSSIRNCAGWLAGSAVCLLLAQGAFLQWRSALEAGREMAWADPVAAMAGDAFCMARTVYEEAVYRFEFAPGQDRDAVLLLANPEGAERPALQANLKLRIGVGEERVFSRSVPLGEKAWTEFRIPAEVLPREGAQCRLSWSEAEEPEWMARLGIRPHVTSNRALAVSGPHDRRPQRGTPGPSIIVLVIEGLGAENMSVLGYARGTTPAMDGLATVALGMTEAYTPTTEAAAACMTVLTGLHPLKHGYFEARRGPLPEGLRILPEYLATLGYATAAFTEGQAPDDTDLVPGSGFDRGFEIFDPTYAVQAQPTLSATGQPAPPAPLGSKITLDKAARWIEAHGEEKSFVFIRLRELSKPMRLRRYGEGFLGRGRVPAPVDIYDTALADVDRQVGAFIERLRTDGILERSVLVLTSTYGFDFTEAGRGAWRRGGPPQLRLSESGLHVPMIFHMPNQSARTISHLVSLEDVTPTLLNLAGIKAPATLSGRDLLNASPRSDVVSVQSNPVLLSARLRQWRFSWQSGRDPVTGVRSTDEAMVEFLDIQRYRDNLAPVDNFQRMPESAQRYREQLAQFLNTCLPGNS